MKLIINTQIHENYGAHDWSGEGNCPQYWKAKGGYTYVVRNITPAQQARIKANGIPHLTKLIEEGTDYICESIIGFCIAADDAVECEEYETPIDMHYDGKNWIGSRTTNNETEYGYLRPQIKKRVESWTMLPGGDRKDYGVTYVMKNGRYAFDNAEMLQVIAEMEAAA